MITVRPASARGHTKLGWLDSRHSFSFGDYHDPKHMGFRHLRVINEDRVKPGKGFGAHSHRDMEIISYVLEGELAHRDSTGTSSVIGAGEVQRVSAGTGISHSEYNHSSTEPLHFLQIWILPEQQGLAPGYEQRQVTHAEKQHKLCLVASGDGRDDALKVHQDIDLYITLLDAGDRIAHRLKPGRHAWIQVARGGIILNDISLSEGDGAALSEEERLEMSAGDEAEILLFDLD